MSRTALVGFPFGDVEMEELVNIIRRFSRLCFVEIMGFCVMYNHFNLIVKMIPRDRFTDAEIKKRFGLFYGDGY